MHNLKNPLVLGQREDGEYYESSTDIDTSAKEYVSKEVAEEIYREANRYFPILARLQDKYPKIWDELTKGTGIATVNGLQNAIQKATT